MIEPLAQIESARRRAAWTAAVAGLVLFATILCLDIGESSADTGVSTAADRKGLRSNGNASRLSAGQLTLKNGRQAYLRFTLPSSWQGSQAILVVDPSSSSTQGIAVTRAKVTWKRGTPAKVGKSGDTVVRSGSIIRDTSARLDVTGLLSPGSARNLRLTATGGGRASLSRMPYLLRYDPPTTIAAVGDIACSPDSSQWNGGAGTATDCRQADVASLVEESDEAVLLLGDVQYPDGTLTQFQAGFGPSWAGFGNRMKPSPGNHEYYTPGATGYFDYFASLGIETGGAGTGYYAFDLGDWTVLSLNSNCSDVPCSAGSAQEVWLRERLQEARELDRCTLTYWHHPPASSGIHGDTAAVADLWRAVVDLGGDLLLAGHDHHYERFVPLNANLEPDPGGPPSWVIGTGGKSLRTVAGTRDGSATVIDSAFGLTRFDLFQDSFEWEWVGLGGVGADSGSADCRA